MVRTNRLGEATASQRELIDRIRNCVIQTPKDEEEQQKWLADCLIALASLEQEQGNISAAEFALREALAVHRHALPAGHADIADALSKLASLLWRQGKLAEAELLFREEVQVWRTVIPADDVGLANALSGLGRVLLAEGKTADAEAPLREAIAIRRTKLGPTSMPTTRTAGALVNLLEQTNRHDEAAAVRKEFGLPKPGTQATTTVSTSRPVTPATTGPSR